MIGALIADRYQIEEELGVGGMGVVYRARQIELNRPVALKLLRPNLITLPRAELRFHREAQAASTLNHPGVVTVHDFGWFDGQAYLVMELLEGRTLDRIYAEGPLELSRLVDLFSQIASAIGAAHEAGLVHRDLKPDNVMITLEADGAELAKVVDFGLALFAAAPAHERLTTEQTVLGTPSYMSPEQCRSQPLTPACDVYALGVMLYEALAGRPPFSGESTMDVMVMHLLTYPKRIEKLVPGRTVPGALEALALAAMEKAPEARPTIDEFAERLVAALSGDDEHAEPPPPALAPTRTSRRAAVGFRTAPQTPAAAEEVTGALVVVEPEADALTSMTAVARAAGFDVTHVEALAEAREAVNHTGAVVVYAVDGPLDDLAEWIPLLSTPVIVVGSDPDFGRMSKALEIGAVDYLPTGAEAKRLPIAVRRARRRRRRTE